MPSPNSSSLAYEMLAAPAELLAGRVLTVTEVVRDRSGIRLEYSIAGTPIDPDETFWVAEGTDDLGDQYEDLGGAYGPSADGAKTEGVITMPLPRHDAQVLHVRFTPRGDSPSMWSAQTYELTISLRNR